MKNPTLNCFAAVLVMSAFTMCTKSEFKTPKKTSSVVQTNDTNLSSQTLAVNSITVQPSQWYVDGTNLPAGTVIYIPAGTRSSLLLKNITGTAASPIIIINKGGKVTFSTSVTASYGFKTQNCRYFKILGNGDPSVEYGFNVNGG